MLENDVPTAGPSEDNDTPETPKAKRPAAKKTTAKKSTAKTATKKASAAKTTAKKSAKKTTKKKTEPAPSPESEAVEAPEPEAVEAPAPEEAPAETAAESDEDATTAARRRRRRGGRRRRKGAEPGDSTDTDESADTGDSTGSTDAAAATEGQQAEPEGSAAAEPSEGAPRRRRRRRRSGEGSEGADDSGSQAGTRARASRSAEEQITAVSGSTRLEAKKQRRREGREAGRRRAPIVSEAEFLARRESVERVMVVRQRADLTQIAVLEDKVLVEHYVSRESQTSLIGNIYLGRVQNVLPSMEAAFVDIGKGRNAVLYAGEVNWSGLGHKEGTPRKIESVLSSGQSVLVQVTKDPVGHKGARLTSQVSLAGRFLVYVPDGTTSGISRKLPDTERNRLKTLLKEIVPDTAGVIVRTAAEGASEDELTRDVERLKAQWEDIEKKAKGSAPQLLYGEPDLTVKVVRDLFTEDFSTLVIEGQDAWDTVQGYVSHVAPDLEDRLQRYEVPDSGGDVFAAYRVDEQISKGLDRKVWLPSGGSLIIDRTEAMTVVDVNTGKFTGSGGNLEETVTKNNLEAAEEIVRQLRLRDIGGIIVVDFIDMVLESNRELVLRRLVECLGRDRTRHQVAEVTSLGLVQMTRKRIGTGLLEAFSHSCEQCGGRGVIVHDIPVEPRRVEEDNRRGGRRSRGGRGRSAEATPAAKPIPSPKDLAAAAVRPTPAAQPDDAPDPDLEPLAEEPVADVPAAEEPLVDVPVAEEAPAEEPEVQEPEVDAPVAEEAPAEEPAKVVTRSRRRSASRPAGPPVLAELGEAPTEGTVEPGTAVIEPGGATVGADEPSDLPAEEPHIEHVPVKRRGARKR